MEPAYATVGLPSNNPGSVVTCVVQDADHGHVLMVAWMNAEALRLTRETRTLHFWSRSRQRLWKKGETSGNTLALVELRFDCDADTLLALARPAGPACHTGKPSCFYRRDDGTEDDGRPALGVFDRLERTLAARRDTATAKASYTKSLLDSGIPAIVEKIREEQEELTDELLDTGNDAKVIHEAADLLFHVMVGLTARRIAFADLEAELARRFGTSGHAEKAARK